MNTPRTTLLGTRRARILAAAAGIVIVSGSSASIVELLRKPCPVCAECEVCDDIRLEGL